MTFAADTSEAARQNLRVWIEIEGPFTASKLILRFPRWVPGSYMIRDPIQFVNSIQVSSNGMHLDHKRIDVDGLSIKLNQDTTKVLIEYNLLAAMLSVRSTHLDETHLHLMPPFTWFLPTSGIDMQRMEMSHRVSLNCPQGWSAATQLSGENLEFRAEGRDELLDGIIELNSNPTHTWIVEGKTHHLRLWDEGGISIPQEGVQRFIEKATMIIKEHHATFGIPDWDNYVTILHLTNSARGGLEHLRSQTSMMPRNCLWKGDQEHWLDLISLFSHEFVHLWNVKRLRPSNMIEYDLSKETHSDLLWWFEGGTSWIGDLICLRSGAWSEEDWRKDWLRKMKRYTDASGIEVESLTESSHDAWIHLYRPNAHSRETQISYYNEGEIAIFCLDAEMRKRSSGKIGVDDIMVEAWKRHGIDNGGQGIKDEDLRRILTSMPGCRNLGNIYDELFKSKGAPPIEQAFNDLGLELIPDIKEDSKGDGWLGLELAKRDGRVTLRRFLANSPCREVMQPGDEIIAIEGIRITDSSLVNKIIKPKFGQEIELTIARGGVIDTRTVNVGTKPMHNVKVNGKGNILWKRTISSKQ